MNIPPPAELVRKIVTHPTAHQFVRFAMVGVLATATHYSILIALVELAHWGAIVSSSIGFCVGALVSYLLNRQLTFKVRPELAMGFLKFFSVVLIGLGFNASIVAAVRHLGAHYLLAQAIATGTVLFWNFGATRLLVFSERSAR